MLCPPGFARGAGPSAPLRDLCVCLLQTTDTYTVRVTLTRSNMGLLPPYIPAKNANLLAWAANFSGLIAANPATYGLVTGDATAITAQYTALNTAYALITSPSTKTAATVSAFNTEKIVAIGLFRPYAQSISLNAGVSSANKTALGVNPRTSVPLPITTPTTWPVALATSSSTAGIIVRYHDSSTPSVKSKPYGVIGALVYAKASLTPITDPTLLSFEGTQTKTPFTLSMPATAGMTIYIAIRWVTKKGLVGPWSPIISFVSSQA
jgi:hypothetical protein